MRSPVIATICCYIGWNVVSAHFARDSSCQNQSWKSAPASDTESVFAKFPVEQRMADFNITGVSIAFIQNNAINWTKGYGFADREANRSVDPSTVFQAASISKPVAALAALHYVEQGNLSLDENINKYLNHWQIPENQFTTHEKVTLRRLLSHSAGLTVWGFPGYAMGEAIPTLSQVLEGTPPANTGPVRVDIVPGTKTRYSGGGTTVVQKALIDQVGKSFPEIMSETVLLKIGMETSTYEQPLPIQFRPQEATGYKADGAPVPGLWHTYPEMAAAGLWTTASDLARFAIEIQLSYHGKSNKVISQNMTQQMLTAQLDEFGLGPQVEGEGDALVFSHTGGNEGFRCIMAAFANRPEGVVIMTNSDNGMEFALELVKNISTVYEWVPAEPSPETSTAPSSASGSQPSSRAGSVQFGSGLVLLAFLPLLFFGKTVLFM